VTTTTAGTVPVRIPDSQAARIALVATLVTFIVLYAQPMMNTGRTWWSDPEAGHGLLLAPLAFYLAIISAMP
jgi:hypothetical protein